jgi:hypothetical protein
MKNIGGAAVWRPVLPDEDPETLKYLPCLWRVLVEGSLVLL